MSLLNLFVQSMLRYENKGTTGSISQDFIDKVVEVKDSNVVEGYHTILQG